VLLKKSRRIAIGAAALAVVTITSACSSSGSSGSSNSTGAPSDAKSSSAVDPVLGAEKKATGTPLTIGYITDGKSAAIDFTALQQTAQAAAKYVNAHLGGVGGHPITLKVCETQQVPARATDCANQMVQANVPVVLNDLTGVGSTIVPIIAKANIPYVAFSGSTAPELTTKNVYSLTGSIASFLGGIAEYSKEQGLKKVAVIAMNIPAVTQSLATIGKLVFAKAGVQMQVVTVAPGTADVSPQIETAISGKADGMLVFGDSTICEGSLKAAHTLNYSGTKMVVSQCVQSALAKNIPGGYKGVVVSATTNLQSGDKEYELYKAVLQKYSPDTAKANSTDAGAAEGYGAVLGFARAMASVTSGDITPALVSSTVAGAKNVALPLGGGGTFSCDGTAVTGLPGICSVGAQITILDENGAPTTYKTVDAGALFK
jgi:branched-chain amino acid transport system substrate-binding protein